MIVLTNSTTQIAFSGFTQEAKNFIKDELCSLDSPVFLYQLRVLFPESASSATSSEYNWGGVDSVSQYEDWNTQKDIMWFNCMNSSTSDKYILLPLGLTSSDPDYVKGPTYSPKIELKDGQYTYYLRMVPIGEGVLPELLGTLPIDLFPNGTQSYSNIPAFGWTQSHLDTREILRPSYLLEAGRLTVVNDPILTRIDGPLGYDKGEWTRKDSDGDVYL